MGQLRYSSRSLSEVTGMPLEYPGGGVQAIQANLNAEPQNSWSFRAWRGGIKARQAMVRKATRAIVRGGKYILARRFDAWVMSVSQAKNADVEEGWALRVGRHILRWIS